VKHLFAFALFAWLLLAPRAAEAQDKLIEQGKANDPLFAKAFADPNAPIWLEPRVKALPFRPKGPFLTLKDGGILCIQETQALISRDGGATWKGHKIFGDHKLEARPEQALIRARDGSIVLVFLDELGRRWEWDNEKNRPVGEIHLYTWSIRSLDEGKTWVDLTRITDGYCGAIRDMIQTESGRLVIPVQRYLPDKVRHATWMYYSDDVGKTWHRTQLLDIEGRGHHDGAIEATLVELKDKRIWVLLRTGEDYLFESFSSDGGMTWSGPAKTKFDASSSPAILKRLASGRLAMAWNRLHPEGTTDDSLRRAGVFTQRKASWFRAELSLAFSDDEGATWTDPVVIARHAKPVGWVAYPYIYEREPGLLWITTMAGEFRGSLKESDFAREK